MGRALAMIGLRVAIKRLFRGSEPRADGTQRLDNVAHGHQVDGACPRITTLASVRSDTIHTSDAANTCSWRGFR